jgi:hypothetical protein
MLVDMFRDGRASGRQPSDGRLALASSGDAERWRVLPRRAAAAAGKPGAAGDRVLAHIHRTIGIATKLTGRTVMVDGVTVARRDHTDRLGQHRRHRRQDSRSAPTTVDARWLRCCH